MCNKAHEARERLREKPLESPHMHYLLEKCSKVHLLKKGQVCVRVCVCVSGCVSVWVSVWVTTFVLGRC